MTEDRPTDLRSAKSRTAAQDEVSEGESQERMGTYLDAISIKAAEEFDPEFAKSVARQLSLAADIVEASQGIAPSYRHVVPQIGAHGWVRQFTSFGDVEWMLPSEQVEISSASQEPLLFEYGVPTSIVAPDVTVSPEKPAKVDARRSVQRTGIVASLTITFASTSLILANAPAGMAGMYLGLATFFASQFAADQVDEGPLIVPSDLSAVGFVASIGLVVTAILAAFQVP